MSEKYRTRLERRKALEANKKKAKKEKGSTPFWKKFMLSSFIVVLIVMFAGVITAGAMIIGAPDIDPDQLVLSESAKLMDENDEEFIQLQSSENREIVAIEDIPDHVKNAFIAVEDVRFYDHFGIDIKRVFGAIGANITEGFGAEGASTITQQVVKSAFLSPEKTIERKVQEQYLSIRLEQQYSKEQILETYLNLIYFNKGAYGVGQAAETYFNKDHVEELTVADAALLAAIPRRPAHYDPTNNPEAAEQRRNLIIDLMAEHGFIDSEKAEEAKSIPVEEQIDFQPSPEANMYDSFITHVQEEIEEVEGIDSNDLYTAGLKIYTTLDTDAQEFAERVIQTDEFINNYPDNEYFQVGFTLLDTETGAIKAMVGNHQGQDIAKGINYATYATQPGSTIKPILDYGPAIEYKQWSTWHQVVDEPYQYSWGTPVRNASGTYSGPVSIRKALTDSINVPALKVFQEIGAERASNFARGLGMDFENIGEAYALGGMEEGVSSLQMAGAYAAFGNGGHYTEPYTVRKIEFPDGREIDLTPEPTVAMNDYTAYMITDILKDVVRRGTGTTANIPGLPLAGKTGTTNFEEKEKQELNLPPGAVPDKWFTGYTPKYTAAVWTGVVDRKKSYLGSEHSKLAQNIFRIIMSYVSEGENTPDFKKPDSVVEKRIDRNTGKLPNAYTPSSEIITELFVRGNEPVEETQAFKQPAGVENLSATYDEEKDEIGVSWDYNGDQDDMLFMIQQSFNDSSYETVTTTDDRSWSFTKPEPGDYQFRVIAVDADDQDIRSEGKETFVSVPGPDPDVNEDESGLGDGFFGDEEEEEKREQEEERREEEQEREEEKEEAEEEEKNEGDDAENQEPDESDEEEGLGLPIPEVNEDQ